MPRYRNRLLRALTPRQLAALEPLKRVELSAGQVLYRMEKPVTHFIFPERVLVSYVFVLGDGQAADVLTSGAAMIGGHTTFQVPESLHDIVIRVGGTGWRVPRRRLLRAMDRDPVFRERLRALVHVMDRTMARNVACRVRHSVEERFCRLLLIARDAIESDALHLSIPTMAEMLPVHRGHLSRLTQTMTAAGIIGQDEHRHVVLLNADAVLERACVCYRETAEDRRAVLN